MLTTKFANRQTVQKKIRVSNSNSGFLAETPYVKSTFMKTSCNLLLFFVIYLNPFARATQDVVNTGICAGVQLKRGFHIPDNGNGTYTNPVMPNAHWSDACVLRVNDEFFCATSSCDAIPLMTILRSHDLVNWDVAGSAMEDWPKDLPPAQCWSGRISHINGKFRITTHITGQHFIIMESLRPEGPWYRVSHHFSDMNKQWSANFFTDRDGSTYMIAANWIQKTSADALSFSGKRQKVVDAPPFDHPIIENPSLIRRGDYYYWFESVNGATRMGNQPYSGKLSVWRSIHPMGPYEQSPRDFISANNRFQVPNSGYAVEGPDGNWWFLYNTIDILRLNMCRQLHLDRISWDKDGWPIVNDEKGPSLVNKKPVEGFSPTWIPDLNDDFNGNGLEGLTSGVLGRKWLKRTLLPDLWSVSDGWLRMKTAFPSIVQLVAPNYIFQRPTAANYSMTTRMRFSPTSGHQQAGLMLRETTTGIGLAIGLEPQSSAMDGTMLHVWHNTNGVLSSVSAKKYEASVVYLRLDVNGLTAQTFYSLDGKNWELIGPTYSFAWNGRYFATFFPGLFAGQNLPSPTLGVAEFDYFYYTPMDRE